jgi:hypothetical protein
LHHEEIHPTEGEVKVIVLSHPKGTSRGIAPLSFGPRLDASVQVEPPSRVRYASKPSDPAAAEI